VAWPLQLSYKRPKGSAQADGVGTLDDPRMPLQCASFYSYRLIASHPKKNTNTRVKYFRGSSDQILVIRSSLSRALTAAFLEQYTYTTG
jgi:hypothetical protein